jgi:hypothetical protein
MDKDLLQQRAALLLDRGRSRSYKSCSMMRFVTVALAVVAIFSIAYVLITPDPTDDVTGALRSNHPAMEQKLSAVSVLQSWILVIVLLHFFTSPTSTRHLAALELLDLISVSRC